MDTESRALILHGTQRLPGFSRHAGWSGGWREYEKWPSVQAGALRLYVLFVESQDGCAGSWLAAERNERSATVDSRNQRRELLTRNRK